VLLLHDAASLPGTQRWLEFVGERVYQNKDELNQVLEGRLRLVLDGKAFDATAGACVPIPCGTPHSWRNLADRPVRVVAFSPGGAEVCSPASLNCRREASSRLRRTLARSCLARR
jgi:uncharacterized protein YjlB